MRIKQTLIVGGLGLPAMLLLSYPTPTFAQRPRTAPPVPVRNVDERGRVPYMEFQVVSCPGGDAPTCQIAFPPVPEGKRLVLEHVNASMTFESGVVVRRTGIIAPGNFLFALPARSISDPNLLIVNESILAYYESGQTPIFQVVRNDGADDILVTTVLSGYLVSLED